LKPMAVRQSMNKIVASSRCGLLMLPTPVITEIFFLIAVLINSTKVGQP
jgi:hypothetical protein